ncbi:hypothetical protein T492DRAFT_1143555 [Pavlovales sp. CCMP2436]|nr:hypothetical protein T492DRAFT_1143555 [Pavlovales sp. CCMP2436]
MAIIHEYLYAATLADEHVGETHSTLKFAQLAKHVQNSASVIADSILMLVSVCLFADILFAVTHPPSLSHLFCDLLSIGSSILTQLASHVTMLKLAKHAQNSASVNEFLDDKSLIRRLRKELAGLRHQLALVDGGVPITFTGDTGVSEELQMQLERAQSDLSAERDRREAGLSRIAAMFYSGGGGGGRSERERVARRETWAPGAGFGKLDAADLKLAKKTLPPQLAQFENWRNSATAFPDDDANTSVSEPALPAGEEDDNAMPFAALLAAPSIAGRRRGGKKERESGRGLFESGRGVRESDGGESGGGESGREVQESGSGVRESEREPKPDSKEMQEQLATQRAELDASIARESAATERASTAESQLATERAEFEGQLLQRTAAVAQEASLSEAAWAERAELKCSEDLSSIPESPETPSHRTPSAALSNSAEARRAEARRAEAEAKETAWRDREATLRQQQADTQAAACVEAAKKEADWLRREASLRQQFKSAATAEAEKKEANWQRREASFKLQLEGALGTPTKSAAPSALAEAAESWRAREASLHAQLEAAFFKSAEALAALARNDAKQLDEAIAAAPSPETVVLGGAAESNSWAWAESGRFESDALVEQLGRDLSARNATIKGLRARCSEAERGQLARALELHQAESKLAAAEAQAHSAAARALQPPMSDGLGSRPPPLGVEPVAHTITAAEEEAPLTPFGQQRVNQLLPDAPIFKSGGKEYPRGARADGAQAAAGAEPVESTHVQLLVDFELDEITAMLSPKPTAVAGKADGSWADGGWAQQ